jgi:colicin import membrane protein
MKSVLTWIAACAGGAALFTASFVGFARLGGAPLSGVPLLGRFVEAEQARAEQEHAQSEAAAGAAAGSAGEQAADARSRAEAIESGAVLSAFLMPAPYTSAELEELQRELRTALAQARDRLARVEEREVELDAWHTGLEERRAELAALQDAIELETRELELLRSQHATEERARAQQEAKSWAELARFFEEGDPEDLAGKLARIEPAKAARVLRALDEERASALVHALPPDRFQVYLEAYRTVVP